MLDIRGGLKNTKMSRHPLAVLEELTSNAIDSFLIRQDRAKAQIDFDLEINIEVFSRDLQGDELDLTCEVIDNGNGYDSAAIQAFLTKDTTYKDDLKISGIEQCKGSGRIQYFHVFERVSIDSVTDTGENLRRTQMNFTKGQKVISPDDFSQSLIVDTEPTSIQTKIKLTELRNSARERFAEVGALSDLFSARNVKNFLISTFLQRLIGISSKLGDFEIRVNVSGTSPTTTEVIQKRDLPKLTENRHFKVPEKDPASGDELGSYQDFSLTYYRIDAGDIILSKNAISLCAKSTPVEDITSRYLRTKSQENNELNGAFHIIFIEGHSLDQRVNEQRDGFDDLPPSIPSGDLFSRSKISYSSIFDSLDPIIEDLIAPPDWDREDVRIAATQNFGISEAMLVDTDTRIRYGDDSTISRKTSTSQVSR